MMLADCVRCVCAKQPCMWANDSRAAITVQRSPCCISPCRGPTKALNGDQHLWTCNRMYACKVESGQAQSTPGIYQHESISNSNVRTLHSAPEWHSAGISDCTEMGPTRNGITIPSKCASRQHGIRTLSGEPTLQPVDHIVQHAEGPLRTNSSQGSPAARDVKTNKVLSIENRHRRHINPNNGSCRMHNNHPQQLQERIPLTSL